jgi:hypothetical protein
MVTANIGTIRRLGRIFGALSAAAPPLLPIGLGEWADRVYSRAIAEQFLGSWRQRDALDVLLPVFREFGMFIWLVIICSAIVLLLLTYYFGEMICRSMASRFAERRGRWRELEMKGPRGPDSPQT